MVCYNCGDHEILRYVPNTDNWEVCCKVAYKAIIDINEINSEMKNEMEPRENMCSADRCYHNTDTGII